jgi:excisionase family DNA binding protein
MKLLYEVEEAAAILNAKPSTLRTWIRRNVIPNEVIMKIGGRLQIRAKKLEQFINGEL